MDVTKYIKAEDLLAEVEENLYSIFENQLADTSFLYPIIERELKSIGVIVLPKKSVLLEVTNYQAKLPKDFYSLIMMVSCTSYKVTAMDEHRGNITYEQAVCDLPVCKSECDYFHTDESGQCCSPNYNNSRFSILQRFYGDTYIHRDIKMLSVNKVEQVQNECYNPVSQNYDVNISNNNVKVKFPFGSIYLEYRGELEDKGELLIPDKPQIITWIKDLCIYKVMERLYFNSEGDYAQKLQLAKANLHISKENAKAVWKLFSYKDLRELKDYLHSSFNRKARI